MIQLTVSFTFSIIQSAKNAVTELLGTIAKRKKECHTHILSFFCIHVKLSGEDISDTLKSD